MTKKEITAIANAAVAVAGVREYYVRENRRTTTKKVPFVRLTFKTDTCKYEFTCDYAPDENYARHRWIDLIVYRHNLELRKARARRCY